MSRMAWPLAKFGAIYFNSHVKEGAALVTPYFFIPGHEDKGDYDPDIPLEDMPFEEIEANFRSYDAWYKKNHSNLN